MKRYAYASLDAGTLCVWLDNPPPSATTAPSGWYGNCAGTDYEVYGLCEIACAPDVTIVRISPDYTKAWLGKERGRKIAATKAAKAALVEQQTLIPIPDDVEKLGRQVAFSRGR